MPKIIFAKGKGFLGLLFLPAFLLPVSGLFAENDLDWDSLRAAYAHFAKEPTEPNAAKVSSFLPRNLGYSAPSSSRRNHLETEKFVLKHFGPLESQVFRGKSNAVKLAYRFYTVADGELAETLDVMLGKLICRNPRLFLRELKANRRLVTRLDSILMNYGSDFEKDELAQNAEYKHRLRCLRKVRDPELQEIRDECVEFMEMNP